MHSPDIRLPTGLGLLALLEGERRPFGISVALLLIAQCVNTDAYTLHKGLLRERFWKETAAEKDGKWPVPFLGDLTMLITSLRAVRSG